LHPQSYFRKDLPQLWLRHGEWWLAGTWPGGRGTPRTGRKLAPFDAFGQRRDHGFGAILRNVARILHSLGQKKYEHEQKAIGLLAAGRLGLCQQRFRFAQEALRFVILCPARVLCPLPEALKLGLGFLGVAKVLLCHGEEGEVSSD
jgi:hypothetical protein